MALDTLTAPAPDRCLWRGRYLCYITANQAIFPVQMQARLILNPRSSYLISKWIWSELNGLVFAVVVLPCRWIRIERWWRRPERPTASRRCAGRRGRGRRWPGPSPTRGNQKRPSKRRRWWPIEWRNRCWITTTAPRTCNFPRDQISHDGQFTLGRAIESIDGSTRRCLCGSNSSCSWKVKFQIRGPVRK